MTLVTQSNLSEPQLAQSPVLLPAVQCVQSACTVWLRAIHTILTNAYQYRLIFRVHTNTNQSFNTDQYLWVRDTWYLQQYYKIHTNTSTGTYEFWVPANNKTNQYLHIPKKNLTPIHIWLQDFRNFVQQTCILIFDAEKVNLKPQVSNIQNKKVSANPKVGPKPQNPQKLVFENPKL